MMNDDDPKDEIADLWDAIDALIEGITYGQAEMRALESVLAAHHGLSLDALREAREFQSAREKAHQELGDTARLQALKRLRGRGRVQ